MRNKTLAVLGVLIVVGLFMFSSSAVIAKQDGGYAGAKADGTVGETKISVDDGYSVTAAYDAAGAAGYESESEGAASSVLSASAESDALSYAEANAEVYAPVQDGATVTAVSDATATGGAHADAGIFIELDKGDAGDIVAYSIANADGAGSIARSRIDIDDSVPAGVYYDYAAEPGAAAFAMMFSDGTNIMAITFSDANGGLEAGAAIIVSGSNIDVLADTGDAIFG